jgi:hypothetical protein
MQSQRQIIQGYAIEDSLGYLDIQTLEGVCILYVKDASSVLPFLSTMKVE